MSFECTSDLREAERSPILLVPGTALTPEVNFGWNYVPALSSMRWPVRTVELPDEARADIRSRDTYNSSTRSTARLGRDAPTEEVAMTARAPEDLSPLFQEANRAGNVDAALSLYEPEAVFPNSEAELREGIGAIREEAAAFAAAKPDLTHRVKRVMKSGDVALMYSAWQVTRPVDMSGRATAVVRQQRDGTCRFIEALARTVAPDPRRDRRHPSPARN